MINDELVHRHRVAKDIVVLHCGACDIEKADGLGIEVNWKKG